MTRCASSFFFYFLTDGGLIGSPELAPRRHRPPRRLRAHLWGALLLSGPCGGAPCARTGVEELRLATSRGGSDFFARTRASASRRRGSLASSRACAAAPRRHGELPARRRATAGGGQGNSNPVAPTGRRIKLCWTEEAAAFLREAMAKFTPQNDRKFCGFRY
ncbi:uncharacterized protein LOC120671842 isoform X1 [Panicum virgatum]|uniref:uncharacterized protein LOC120671842 isoform X1 n=1 Tax=Panicum virgatum TaxID=38727 RepID=UPI0019D580B7|nr:uncharacterized protein LOC120671842 isoform X1 [Panicum virgatum]